MSAPALLHGSSDSDSGDDDVAQRSPVHAIYARCGAPTFAQRGRVMLKTANASAPLHHADEHLASLHRSAAGRSTTHNATAAAPTHERDGDDAVARAHAVLAESKRTLAEAHARCVRTLQQFEQRIGDRLARAEQRDADVAQRLARLERALGAQAREWREWRAWLREPHRQSGAATQSAAAPRAYAAAEEGALQQDVVVTAASPPADTTPAWVLPLAIVGAFIVALLIALIVAVSVGVAVVASSSSAAAADLRKSTDASGAVDRAALLRSYANSLDRARVM